MDMILNQGYILSLNGARETSELIVVVLLFAMFCLGIYFVTKFIGKQKVFNNKNSNISIIETITVAPQKYLQLIKVTNKYLLIGITKDNIIFIKELDSEELVINNNEIEVSFKKYLDKFKSKSRNE